MIRLSLINLYRRLMDNHFKLTEQYAKLKVLYETVIYLNAQIKKEHDTLEKLKAKEDKHVS
jgi:cell division protein FtsB